MGINVSDQLDQWVRSRARANVFLMYVAKEVSLRSERRVVTLENHLKNIALVGVSSKFTHPVT